MGARGPRPLPVTELKLRGTHRKDRHGDRQRIPETSGTPKKPAHLKGAGAAEWARIVPELVKLKLVGAIDTSVLVATCEAWQLYRAAFDLAEKSPTDKEARCAVTAYHAQYLAGVTKLGLSPLDRGRLQIDKEPAAEPGLKLKSFARRRSG